MDDARFPGAGSQDPLLLDGEREKLSSELPTAAGQLEDRISDFCHLLARLRGTVVHAVLDAAMRDPNVNLTHLGRACLGEQGLDATLAEHAVAIVHDVMASDVWRRAHASPWRFSEIPFQTLMPPDPGAISAVPTILRGVIDLVFREADGWVVLDYKTDSRSEAELPALVAHYRGQMKNCADFWQATVGEPVVEQGLYFTHAKRYLRI